MSDEPKGPEDNNQDPSPESKSDENKIPEGSTGLLDAEAKRQAEEKGGEPEQKEPETPERPENVPEKFWDAEKGEVRTDGLMKAYEDTRKALERTKSDSAPVKDVSEYITEDIAVDGKLILPDGSEEVNTDDPAFVGMLNALKSHDVPPEQGAAILQDMVKVLATTVDTELNLEEELGKLGENGRVIAETTFSWLEGLSNTDTLTSEEHDALMVFGADAEGMVILNKLRMESGERPIPSKIPSADPSGPSREKWEEMMKDPKYKTDPSFRARTEAYGEQVFGNAPATSTVDISKG